MRGMSLVLNAVIKNKEKFLNCCEIKNPSTATNSRRKENML